MRDITVYVSCKFEMYIFKIALVISENVRIAFLYVLSIYLLLRNFKLLGWEPYVVHLSHPALFSFDFQHRSYKISSVVGMRYSNNNSQF